jgi:hypothetical protein
MAHMWKIIGLLVLLAVIFVISSWTRRGGLSRSLGRRRRP